MEGDEMPKDWWPEIVIVTGRVSRDGKVLTQSVALTAQIAVEPIAFRQTLDRLRLNMWQESQKCPA